MCSVPSFLESEAWCTFGARVIFSSSRAMEAAKPALKSILQQKNLIARARFAATGQLTRSRGLCARARRHTKSLRVLAVRVKIGVADLKRTPAVPVVHNPGSPD